MKTWHFIAIGGLLLIGGVVFLRSRATSTAVPGDKVGTGAPGDAGAPPLPIVAPSQPATGTSLAFFTYNKLFARRIGQ